jgi:hypothetical protein
VTALLFYIFHYNFYPNYILQNENIILFKNAALYTPQTVGEWGPDKFALWVSYVGPPWAVMWLALIVGIGYLAWAEFGNYRKK